MRQQQEKNRNQLQFIATICSSFFWGGGGGERDFCFRFFFSEIPENFFSTFRLPGKFYFVLKMPIPSGARCSSARGTAGGWNTNKKKQGSLFLCAWQDNNNWSVSSSTRTTTNYVRAKVQSKSVKWKIFWKTENFQVLQRESQKITTMLA